MYYRAMYLRAEWRNGLVEERLVVAKASGREMEIVLVLEGDRVAKALEAVRRYGVLVDSGVSVNECGRIVTADYMVGEGVLRLLG